MWVVEMGKRGRLTKIGWCGWAFEVDGRKRGTRTRAVAVLPRPCALVARAEAGCARSGCRQGFVHAASVPPSLTLTAIDPNMLESSRELTRSGAVVVPRERSAVRAAVFPSHLHMLEKRPPPSVHAHHARYMDTLAYDTL